MILNLIQNVGDVDSIELSKLDYGNFYKDKLSARISPVSKIQSYKELFFCLQNEITAVCFDTSMSSVANRCDELNIHKLSDISEGVDFNKARAVFFTSGTTALPRGAVKTEQMIRKEVGTQIEYFSQYDFDSVLVTVPLYHIYGYLFGFELPRAMGINVYTKELFTPYELTEFTARNKTLCVTTPIFIKAMSRIGEAKNLSNTVFVSSTGALSGEETRLFCDKFGATIVQIYGSTETGGIAYKKNDEKLWTPIRGVSIFEGDDEKLCVSSPYLSEQIFEESLKSLSTPFQTSDIVTFEEGRFEIVARSFEVLKIGGKRVSVIEIENTLENIEHIDEAQVIPIRSSGLKDEKLEILIVSGMTQKELSSIVLKSLKTLYPQININAKIKKVEEIQKSFNGKKKRGTI